MSKADLTLARATRDQMQRALKACTVDLEQANRTLDEALERLRARQQRTCPVDDGCTL